MNEINTHQLEKERMSGGRASPDTGTPSRLIKEKLLKGCGNTTNYICPQCNKEMDYINDFDIMSCECGNEIEYEGHICKSECLCEICKAKLQQHEETSKAKDEEFIKILDELKVDEINLDGLSDTQQYKLAGNGQSVNVVAKIFEKMFCSPSSSNKNKPKSI